MEKCKISLLAAMCSVAVLFSACSNGNDGILEPVFRQVPNETDTPDPTENEDPEDERSAVERTFDGRIDLENLENYANQLIPGYIDKDNSGNNPITNAGATLGRVLFYDVNLSIDNTISCASCHQQALAFGDDAIASVGVNGQTGRHSMRLVNARFADEDQFFWDERAQTLEIQTSQPIQDHVEMGFSGQAGNPDLDDLIDKLQEIDYYQELFMFVYGDPMVNEVRIQLALAQFVRSIQSFDSKYDMGRAQVNDNQPFPNFTQQENQGKNLFMQRPQLNNQGVRTAGGAGCNACHRAPEFDIAPNSRNNGLIETLSGQGTDTDVTRSPSLRDLVNVSGTLNGPLMHTGGMSDLATVIDHYNEIEQVPNLDNRLRAGGGPGGGGGGGGAPQNLGLSDEEKEALVAFLQTLTGSAVYADSKWSDPF
ncbi:MAG: cytochrome-c peroxidase [Bacteroidota bacterium]